MTNVQINGGSVEYGRTLNLGEYNNKKCSVMLTFSIPDGEDVDPCIKAVSNKAMAHCLYMASKKESEIAAVATPEAKPAPAKEVPAKVAAKAPKMPKAENPHAAGEAALAADLAAKAAEIEDPSEVKAPKFIEKEVAAQNKKASAAEVEDDDMDDIFGTGEVAAREISDKELNDAAQKCTQETMNKKGIRAAISEAVKEAGLTHPPARLIDIPQNKRQKFLADLKALKPLA